MFGKESASKRIVSWSSGGGVDGLGLNACATVLRPWHKPVEVVTPVKAKRSE